MHHAADIFFAIHRDEPNDYRVFIPRNLSVLDNAANVSSGAIMTNVSNPSNCRRFFDDLKIATIRGIAEYWQHGLFAAVRQVAVFLGLTAR